MSSATPRTPGSGLRAPTSRSSSARSASSGSSGRAAPKSASSTATPPPNSYRAPRAADAATLNGAAPGSAPGSGAEHRRLARARSYGGLDGRIYPEEPDASPLSLGSQQRPSDSAYTVDDVKQLPQALMAVLQAHHARVIDLFRMWDENDDGLISVGEFSRGLAMLELDDGLDEKDVNELFARLDVSGDGYLDYEELHRILRVGSAADRSSYVRKSARPMRPHASHDYVAPRGPRHVELGNAPEVGVDEGRWPAGLRESLVRERGRVIDLFRHWEGGEDGAISVEHFKAGLYLLGLHATRADVRALFGAMLGLRSDAPPSADDGPKLPFRELRRQLRIAAQRVRSSYLRESARQGAHLEASQPRGSLTSGVARRTRLGSDGWRHQREPS